MERNHPSETLASTENWVTRRSFWALPAAGIGALALALGLRPSVTHPRQVHREVDGGPGYYGQFSYPLSLDVTSYFPLGVWFESVISQRDIDLDKDAGLNLYVLLTGNSNLALVEKNGMRAILQQSEWRTNRAAIGSPAVAGWELFDEIDMQHGPGSGYAILQDIRAKLPNDGRMRYSNYGKGVMFWQTDAQAERFVSEFQDIVSHDVYWFTDPNVMRGGEGGVLLNNRRPLSRDQVRRASNYGATVDRARALDALDGRSKPVWNIVEVGWPFTETATQGARAVDPAEVRAAVWHSIIAGARGIIYFNHSFGGPHPSQHCLREPAYGAVRSAVKTTNVLITHLAPVLNSPFVDGVVNAGPSVRTMAKFHQNRYYIFAGSRENRESRPVFSMPDITHGIATVIGEDRVIPIANGKFSDGFADGNAIHIYRIDGG